VNRKPKTILRPRRKLERRACQSPEVGTRENRMILGVLYQQENEKSPEIEIVIALLVSGVGLVRQILDVEAAWRGPPVLSILTGMSQGHLVVGALVVIAL
jgi:hypothetical protein